MKADVIAAFFAGLTAVGTGIFAMWHARRSERKACDEKLQAFKDGLHEQAVYRGDRAG